MTPRWLLYLFLLAITALRLALLGQVELSPDEAYYFQWSQHLDLSYYSKGPGIALTMWAGTHLFGDTAFGIRFFSPLLALGTSLLLFHLARRLHGEPAAIWTVLLLNCIPIFQVGGVLMTIDPLSIFFWVAALSTFWRALEKSPAFSLWWPATGALIGCGFLAKYTNAMQLLSILLLLLFTAKFRRELRSPGFFAMLGVFALFTIPVLVWNAERDWITVHHLSARGGLSDAPRFSLGEFFTYLILHLGVYSPLIFAGLLGCLGWAWKRAGNHFKPRFLLAFILPLLVLYFVLAFKQAGEPNWTAPALVTLAILAVPFWIELARERQWARRFAAAALILGAAMSVLVLDMDLFRRAGIPLTYERDPSGRLRGWQTGAEAIGALRAKVEAESGKPVFLIGNKYGTAAALAFYLKDKRPEGPGHPPIYCPESAALENQYSFWPRYDGNIDFSDTARELLAPANALAPGVRQELADSLAAVEASDPADNQDLRHRFFRALKAADPQLPIDTYFTDSMGYSPFIGRSALYITDRPEERSASAIQKGFGSSEMIACIDIRRRGQPLRQLRVFLCHDYHQSEL